MGNLPAQLSSKRLRRSRPVTRYGAVSGNRLRLFTVGDHAFAAALGAMESARARIWLETYIFEPDVVGNTVRDALVAAAERGCSVLLLVDRFGSPKIDERYLRPIIAAGGRAAVFNPVLPWRRLGRKLSTVLHRDHRKILIVDDVGFCGGANVSLDYGGPGPELFFDMTLRIEGPVVQDLASLFLETLRAASGEAPPLPARRAKIPGGGVAQVLSLSRRQGRRDLDHVLEDALSGATEQCLLMTPYFVPPRWFTQALIGASVRGVDVRILTAGRSDVPFARVAGRHLYRKLLEAGVRVFEMQDPILHAKSMTIDARYSIVGSYNVDEYGSKHNLEVAIASQDSDLARQITKEFMRRAAASEEILPEAWATRPRRVRIGEWLLHLLFRI
jgi:cardiolipin synthase